MPTALEWGIAIWFMLHCIAAAFPEKPTDEHKNAVIKLFHSLSQLLPCSICSNHLKEYLKQHKIEDNVENREQFERYVYDLHEHVNKSRGKTQMHTFEEVQNAFRGEWKGFGGYPFSATKDKINKQKQEIHNQMEKNKELTARKKERDRNKAIVTVLSVCLVFATLGFGITGFALYRKSNSKTCKK
jgi:hypothetical protein